MDFFDILLAKKIVESEGGGEGDSPFSGEWTVTIDNQSNIGLSLAYFGREEVEHDMYYHNDITGQSVALPANTSANYVLPIVEETNHPIIVLRSASANRGLNLSATDATLTFSSESNTNGRIALASIGADRAVLTLIND